jgi:hypothetical protein
MPRSLTIYFPGGRTTEYWYTALVFKVGDKLERNGESWVVFVDARLGSAQNVHSF